MWGMLESMPLRLLSVNQGPSGTTVGNANHINARYEPLPKAGAQRTLLAVGSIPWFGWACHSAAPQIEGTAKIARVAQPPPWQ
jgi:hypothetical protein